jgi:hypothetical protein
MSLGNRVAALPDMLLGERPFEQLGAFFCDGLGFEQKVESFLQLIFGQGFLCFGQILGVKSLAELVRPRTRLDELRQKGKYKNSDDDRKLFGAAFHLVGKNAQLLYQMKCLEKT